MKHHERSSTAARRAAYLQTAIQLRKNAAQSESQELQEGFMRLAVLYEELAEALQSRAFSERLNDRTRGDTN